ncbi:MAG: FeoB-associated Cys-rich membrane protein [Roseburia sp.]|nr:FeoB-associated Cys-rich membrane protein [Roseburia sp.]
MTALEIVLIILIILFVGGIVGWRVWRKVRAKRNGESAPSCGCGCSSCSACAAKCPSQTADEKVDDDMPPVAVQSTVSCDFSDVVANLTKTDVAAENGDSGESAATADEEKPKSKKPKSGKAKK